jgi:hypothetical protein
VPGRGVEETRLGRGDNWAMSQILEVEPGTCSMLGDGCIHHEDPIVSRLQGLELVVPKINMAHELNRMAFASTWLAPAMVTPALALLR